jgi:hypothetical protein
MWHFFALEVDPSTNGASLSVDYQAIQTCSINALFIQSVSIVFQASLPQVFASISLLSYSNTTGSILNRDAISRLRMTSGAIYSTASLLLAYWPGQELTDNKTLISTIISASTPAVLVLDGSFTYADVAVPFQNPVISQATTMPDTIPNNVQSLVTITGRDFSLSPYLVCIFSSKQCNVSTSLFPLNLNFAACAFPAIYASRTSVSCIVPSLFSQAMINVSVTNSLPGLSSSSSALKVMESVIQVGSLGSVSASTLNANSTTNSSGRTFTFWLYIAQSVQALPEYRFFSVQIVCSNVSNATFALSLQSGGLLKAYYPTASLPLTTLPSQPTGLSIGWHFVAVTLQPNGLFLYVDNSDFTFAPSNVSCSNSSCVSVSLESTPVNFTQASGGSLIFSQFRIFDGFFDPVYRGFTSITQVNAINFRLTSSSDFSPSASRSLVTWNFNLCNCTSFSAYPSSANSVNLTARGSVSVVFRSVPWLLPQIDSFSPNFGYTFLAFSIFSSHAHPFQVFPLEDQRHRARFWVLKFYFSILCRQH